MITIDIYKQQLLLFMFCIKNELITDKKEVIEWIDDEIMQSEEVPFCFYDLSLAHSVDDIQCILINIFLDNNITDEDLNVGYLVSYLKRIYETSAKSELEIISIIFGLKSCRYFEYKLDNDICCIDYAGEQYLENRITLTELKERLNVFLCQYSIISEERESVQ